MRGIVSLAAALALPAIDGKAFPHRDLIVLTAFAVVLGTLVIQGLTLGRCSRPSISMTTTRSAGKSMRPGTALSTPRSRPSRTICSAAAAAVREELSLAPQAGNREPGRRRGPRTAHEQIHRRAIGAARQTILDLRSRDEIGDDAFHRLEEEFDWLEMGTLAGADADATSD